jgi:general secretion pathway protein K
MRKTIALLKDESGIALLMAIFTVTMLMVIATEIMYETNVELAVSSQSINQVKAHYAAKAGVEMALLRIQIFRKASSMAGDAVPKSMIDQIWQMPVTWPPVVPKEATAVDKDEVKASVKKSVMQGTYLSTIESEGAKIDVNDLASTVKVVADSTHQQILDIFNDKLQNDEVFGKKYQGTDFNKLINSIADWVDPGKESRNGGQKSSFYADLGQGDKLPPGQAFKTMQELHMVVGMTDDFYKVLEPRITVFGAKGINVNYASKGVLMALSPLITEERADKILEAKDDPNRGPFKDEKDFAGYLATLGIQQDPFMASAQPGQPAQPTVPLVFDLEFNFRIRSTGISGKVTRDITAIVYDYDRVKSRLQDLMKAAAPTPASGPGVASTPGVASQPGAASTPASSKPAVPNERPNIVYWNET